MAKVTVEFKRAEVTATGYLFETEDGIQKEFVSIEEIKEYVAEMETQENAFRLGIGRLLHQEPNLVPTAPGNKLQFLINKAVDLEVIALSPVVLR